MARIIVSDDEEDLEDPSKQGKKIAEIDQDLDISLVQHDAEVQGRHEHDMELDFEFTTAEEVYTAEKEVSTAEPVSTAGASVSTDSASSAKDKGKAIIEEAKTIQTKTKLQLEQERLGYEEALRLQAEIDKEERQRIARVQEEASSLNIEEWDDIQARVGANEEFAQRLQSEEREMYSEAEKERLLAELINERKRYFAAQRAKERRNKPLTQAQQRTYMSQYIKNMGSHTLKQLKSYSFDEIKNLFETTMRRVHTFVPMESESERVIPELAAGSSKRDAEEELVQESSKRQKTGESSEPVEEPKDKEEEELSQERIQQMMIIVPEQGMNVEALQTKYPIIDWEIYTEGARKYWKIIRVGNHTEVYQFFDDMLKAFDREDLVKLWSLVKEKFTSTEPTEDKEREIWVELKRLFEPDTNDELWKLQKHIHDITWRLYDTCGVHHISTKDGVDIYILVKREYLLSRLGKLSRYTSNPDTQYWQAIQRVLKYLKTTMDYSLIYTGYPSVLEGYTDASWINNTKDNSSTSGWAYIKMYNGKSRHLGVRHSMIHELITNRVVSIEFVRSQQKLVDYLMKELARDLVLKSAEGMGLKSNQVAKC
ncbi:hypothetical protein Tco_0178143 [Tanacetum coccineum]